MDDNTGDFQLERDKDRALSLRVTKMSLKGGEAGGRSKKGQVVQILNSHHYE